MDLTDRQWAILEPTFRPRRRPRTQRRALGVAHRGAVARFAGAGSAVPNVPSPLSTVATQRATRPGAPTVGGRSPRPRQDRSVRRVCRCHLRRGKTRGPAVGPTRRGKGSTIMAICDRHRLPLAMPVASASPRLWHRDDRQASPRAQPKTAAPSDVPGVAGRSSASLRSSGSRRSARREVDFVVVGNCYQTRPETAVGVPDSRALRAHDLNRMRDREGARHELGEPARHGCRRPAR